MFNIFKKKKEQKIPRTLMGVLGIFYYSNTYPNIPNIICADGSELGISYDLSLARGTDSLFISYTLPPEKLLKPYESADNSYEYVPISLVRHIIEDIHGGIIGWEGLKEVELQNKELNKCIPSRDIILPYKIINW